MAHSLSAKKRIRQNTTRRLRNQSRRSELKTEIRRFLDLVRAQDVSAARDQLKRVYKKLDQTASTGPIHANAAARQKSRLAKRLTALEASAATTA